MKQHPVSSAFAHIDTRAAPEFRETLRAELLADLAAHTSAYALSRIDRSHRDHHQETIVMQATNKSSSSIRGRRVLLGVAAAVIVAVGVTAVVVNRNNVGSNSVPATDQGATSTTDSGVEPFSQPITVTGDALPFFDPNETVDPAVGQPAPLINGFDFQGNPIAVDPATNGAYMIVFLAHWCPHCDIQLARMSEWGASADAPTALNVLGVSTAPSESAQNFPPARWFASSGWSWPVLVDEAQGDGAAGKAAAAYGPTGWPYIVIIGADGLVKARFVGEIEISDLQAIVDEALAS